MNSDDEDAAATLLGLKPAPEDDKKKDHRGPPKKRKVDERSRREHIAHRDPQQPPSSDDEPASKPKATKKKRKKRKSHAAVEHNYPIPPRVVQICKVPKTHVNQYVDQTFSIVVLHCFSVFMFAHRKPLLWQPRSIPRSPHKHTALTMICRVYLPKRTMSPQQI